VASTAIQAHRGSPDPRAGVGENTLAAFARARSLGADGVELDARLSSDGVVVVHHDPEVDGLGPVAALRADALPPAVPTLAEALAACAGMRVNIEVKNTPGEPGFDPGDHLAREVAAVVAGSGSDLDVMVSSFWPGALEEIHRAAPGLSTGLLVASWFDPEELVPAALLRSCSAVHPPAGLVSGALVGQAHREGLAVAAWTVNEPAAMRSLASLGVDTLITDDVALAREVLDPRP
jgi:glycerophosphoryl diester phosphodiesterase